MREGWKRRYAPDFNWLEYFSHNFSNQLEKDLASVAKFFINMSKIITAPTSLILVDVCVCVGGGGEEVGFISNPQDLINRLFILSCSAKTTLHFPDNLVRILSFLYYNFCYHANEDEYLFYS